MKKTSFSFRAVRAGGYLHHFFLGKKRNAARHRNRPRAVMAATILTASLGMSAVADAQCNTFQNADAANPLLSVIPAGKTITGFDFADIDGDGLLDCYVRFDRDNKLTLYHNIGTADHAEFIESKRSGFENDTLPPSTNIYLSANQYMQFVDIDGDGDLDFFITSQSDVFYGYATVMYYKNTGTNKVPHFIEDEAENPAGVAGCYYYVPFKFADIDGDGDYDLYYDYQAQYGYNTGLSVYMNTGTKFSPHFVDYSYTICGCHGDGRTYYDWNKDALLDYFVVNDELDIKPDFYKNIGPKEAPHYVLDNNDKPAFKNGSPYRMIDLNNDGEPEVFNATGHYSTLAPVAVIEDTVVKNGNKMLTVLSSKNRGMGYQYKWEYNGKIIPAATHAYIYAAKPGTYTLYVTSECGTGVSLNYEVKNNAPLLSAADSKMAGIVTDISKIGVKAYPNPFVNSFTLQLPGKACTVKITDVAGRVLLAQTTAAATLQVGEKLKAGSYIIAVWQDKEMIYNATMVKQ